jgi:hypothetical protein
MGQAAALGDLGLGDVEPSTARILTTNALRWALPPSTSRQGTETFGVGRRR